MESVMERLARLERKIDFRPMDVVMREEELAEYTPISDKHLLGIRDVSIEVDEQLADLWMAIAALQKRVSDLDGYEAT